MTRYAFTADETHEDIIEAEEERGNHDSTAAAIRTLLEQPQSLQEQCDECEDRVTELEQEITQLEQECEERVEEVRQSNADRVTELEQDVERLEREKRMILKQRDDLDTLQTYVDEEQTWREQPLSTRLRWWIFGKSGD